MIFQIIQALVQNSSYQEPGKFQLEWEKTVHDDSDLTWTLELADKNFKAAIKMIVH